MAWWMNYETGQQEWIPDVAPSYPAAPTFNFTDPTSYTPVNAAQHAAAGVYTDQSLATLSPTLAGGNQAVLDALAAQGYMIENGQIAGFNGVRGALPPGLTPADVMAGIQRIQDSLNAQVNQEINSSIAAQEPGSFMGQQGTAPLNLPTFDAMQALRAEAARVASNPEVAAWNAADNSQEAVGDVASLNTMGMSPEEVQNLLSQGWQVDANRPGYIWTYADPNRATKSQGSGFGKAIGEGINLLPDLQTPAIFDDITLPGGAGGRGRRVDNPIGTAADKTVDFLTAEIPYSKEVQSYAGDIGALITKSSITAPAIDLMLRIVGADFTSEDVGRGAAELAVPIQVWEGLIELLPGVGAVPGVASFLGKDLATYLAKNYGDDIAARVAKLAATSEMGKGMARALVGKMLETTKSGMDEATRLAYDEMTRVILGQGAIGRTMFPQPYTPTGIVGDNELTKILSEATRSRPKSYTADSVEELGENLGTILTRLEDEGYDIDELSSILDDLSNIDRSEFETAADFKEAVEETYDDFLEKVKNVKKLEEGVEEAFPLGDAVSDKLRRGMPVSNAERIEAFRETLAKMTPEELKSDALMRGLPIDKAGSRAELEELVLFGRFGKDYEPGVLDARKILGRTPPTTPADRLTELHGKPYQDLTKEEDAELAALTASKIPMEDVDAINKLHLNPARTLLPRQYVRPEAKRAVNSFIREFDPLAFKYSPEARSLMDSAKAVIANNNGEIDGNVVSKLDAAIQKLHQDMAKASGLKYVDGGLLPPGQTEEEFTTAFANAFLGGGTAEPPPKIDSKPLEDLADAGRQNAPPSARMQEAAGKKQDIPDISNVATKEQQEEIDAVLEGVRREQEKLRRLEVTDEEVDDIVLPSNNPYVKLVENKRKGKLEYRVDYAKLKADNPEFTADIQEWMSQGNKRLLSKLHAADPNYKAPMSSGNEAEFRVKVFQDMINARKTNGQRMDSAVTRKRWVSKNTTEGLPEDVAAAKVKALDIERNDLIYQLGNAKKAKNTVLVARITELLNTKVDELEDAVEELDLLRKGNIDVAKVKSAADDAAAKTDAAVNKTESTGIQATDELKALVEQMRKPDFVIPLNDNGKPTVKFLMRLKSAAIKAGAKAEDVKGYGLKEFSDLFEKAIPTAKAPPNIARKKTFLKPGEGIDIDLLRADAQMKTAGRAGRPKLEPWDIRTWMTAKKTPNTKPYMELINLFKQRLVKAEFSAKPDAALEKKIADWKKAKWKGGGAPANSLGITKEEEALAAAKWMHLKDKFDNGMITEAELRAGGNLEVDPAMARLSMSSEELGNQRWSMVVDSLVADEPHYRPELKYDEEGNIDFDHTALSVIARWPDNLTTDDFMHLKNILKNLQRESRIVPDLETKTWKVKKGLSATDLLGVHTGHKSVDETGAILRNPIVDAVVNEIEGTGLVVDVFDPDDLRKVADLFGVNQGASNAEIMAALNKAKAKFVPDGKGKYVLVGGKKIESEVIEEADKAIRAESLADILKRGNEEKRQANDLVSKLQAILAASKSMTGDQLREALTKELDSQRPDLLARAQAEWIAKLEKKQAAAAAEGLRMTEDEYLLQAHALFDSYFGPEDAPKIPEIPLADRKRMRQEWMERALIWVGEQNNAKQARDAAKIPDAVANDFSAWKKTQFNRDIDDAEKEADRILANRLARDNDKVVLQAFLNDPEYGPATRPSLIPPDEPPTPKLPSGRVPGGPTGGGKPPAPPDGGSPTPGGQWDPSWLGKMSKDSKALAAEKKMLEGFWPAMGSILKDVVAVHREALASIDLSGVLRQTWAQSISHPILATNNMWKAAQVWASVLGNDRAKIGAIRAAMVSKRADLMFEGSAKLAVGDIIRVGERSSFNDFVAASPLEDIPVIGRMFKGSREAYEVYVEKMRVDVFNSAMDKLEANRRALPFGMSRDANTAKLETDTAKAKAAIENGMNLGGFDPNAMRTAIYNLEVEKTNKMNEAAKPNFSRSAEEVKIGKEYDEKLKRAREALKDMTEKGTAPSYTADSREVQALINWINVSTGVGYPPDMIKKIMEETGSLIFAPRLLFSRLQTPWYMLKAIAPMENALPAAVRQQIAADMVTSISMVGSLVALAHQFGVAEVEWDPRSSDWGKMKIGQTRIDPWGGYQQVARMLVSLAAPTGLPYVGGKKSLTGEEYKGQWNDGFNGVMQFLLNKMAPTPATLFEVGAGMTGADRTPTGMTTPIWARQLGKEVNKVFPGFNDMDEWQLDPTGHDPFLVDMLERIAPLFLQDLWAAWRENQSPQAALLAIPAFFGMGAQSFTTGNERINNQLAKMREDGIRYYSPSDGKEVLKWSDMDSADRRDALAKSPELERIFRELPKSEVGTLIGDKEESLRDAFGVFRSNGNGDLLRANLTEIESHFADLFRDAMGEGRERTDAPPWMKTLGGYFEGMKELDGVIDLEGFRTPTIIRAEMDNYLRNQMSKEEQTKLDQIFGSSNLPEYTKLKRSKNVIAATYWDPKQADYEAMAEKKNIDLSKYPTLTALQMGATNTSLTAIQAKTLSDAAKAIDKDITKKYDALIGTPDYALTDALMFLYGYTTKVHSVDAAELVRTFSINMGIEWDPSRKVPID